MNAEAIVEATHYSHLRGERGAKRQFSLRLTATYRFLSPGITRHDGGGTTLQMGSAELSLKTDSPLIAGESVQLCIAWPVDHERGAGLQLIVYGRITEVDGVLSTVLIEKYEFRTRPKLASERKTQVAGQPAGHAAVPILA